MLLEAILQISELQKSITDFESVAAYYKVMKIIYKKWSEKLRYKLTETYYYAQKLHQLNKRIKHRI